MTKDAFLKFLLLSQSNLKRFVLVNLILLIPIFGLFYSLYRLIPQAIQFLDSFNLSVEWVHEDFDRLTIAVVSGDTDRVYLFKREDFNPIRRYLFSADKTEEGTGMLESKSLGYNAVLPYGNPVTIKGKDGNAIARVVVEEVKENVIQILFFKRSRRPSVTGIQWQLVIFVSSFILFFGSLGGVSDFTQRVVFHEMKSFSYLFQSIQKFFWRSLLLSLIFFIVLGAIGTNIYFYIFIISSDFSVFIAALNFWMLVFFVFILYWAYPLLILNREESVWRVMKKSLFISFDNFEFTMDCLVFTCFLFVMSCATLFVIPGISGGFSFMNTALKDISYRYAHTDTA
jgi:hypothetical protein